MNRDVLERYATVIVKHGLNVQADQLVQITAESVHRDLVRMIAEQAYDAGAAFVQVDFTDPFIDKARIDRSTEGNLSFVPRFVRERYDELVEVQGATLRLTGSDHPELLAGCSPQRVNAVRTATRKAAKRFYDEGIECSKIHWCVAGAATEGWARKIFPDLRAEEAVERLWDAIFKVARADSSKCLELWSEHQDKLSRRARELTNLGIERLRFVGPGTDLSVYLSTAAIFKGGAEMGPRGAMFEPNIPTEECFSAPDARKTSGRVRATRPFLVNGTMIENLELTFEAGEIVDFACTAGRGTFEAYLNTDNGAKRLGEVALVGIDSPVYRSGLIFREILFDENAACHIAIGMAYRHCLRGGDTMNEEELASHGCNSSLVHTDIMISSEDVSVIATTRTGEERTIIDRGEWRLA